MRTFHAKQGLGNFGSRCRQLKREMARQSHRRLVRRVGAIRKLPFQRLVKEISVAFRPDVHWQASAMLALRAAAESYVVDVMQAAERHRAQHTLDETLMPQDMRAVLVV